MPEPTLRVRRSARRFPANTFLDTMWRCSSVFRNRSSNSSERSSARFFFCGSCAVRPVTALNAPLIAGPNVEPVVHRVAVEDVERVEVRGHEQVDVGIDEV